ncbi:MAG: pre-peptidase C-terminal domain-containing protein [Candidatus Thorarchaeota archaeon]
MVESAHPYSNNYDNTWTITAAGASQIRVHFTMIDVERNYDYVYVYDYANTQLHRLTGLYSSGGWSAWSYGESINVRLDTDYSVTAWGFKIDQVEYEGGGGGGGGDNVLQNGVTATSSLASQYATEMWTIQVDADAESMYSVLTCGSADFDLYGRRGAEPTTSTYDWRGYTYGGEEVTFDNPGAGTWYIMVRSYSGTGSYALTVTITYGGGGGGGEAEKIGVFFWASDAGTQTVINEYKGYLQNEGYTKFFDFKDTTNFANDFATVAAYEDADDIVFFYLFGHGNNDGSHSLTAFRTGGYSVVYSNTFRSYCDTLDSTKVGLLISSCHSGDWADDMYGGGYLAMSSSDEEHNSWSVGPLPGEEAFANYFWNYVNSGYDAVDAFWAARAQMPTSGTYVQNPKICDQCTYNFFG